MTYQPIDPDSLGQTPYDEVSDEHLMANVRHYDDAIRPVAVEFRDEKILISLADGRVIGAPLAWFPVLEAASEQERGAVEFSSIGLHWESCDEDINVEQLLKGIRPRPANQQLHPV